MMLKANELADEADYAHTIRDYLLTQRGSAPARRRILDARGTRSICR